MSNPSSQAIAGNPLPDDSMLISEDWLREVGFDDCRPCHVWGTPNSNWWNDKLRLEIWPFNDSGEWL